MEKQGHRARGGSTAKSAPAAAEGAAGVCCVGKKLTHTSARARQHCWGESVSPLGLRTFHTFNQNCE